MDTVGLSRAVLVDTSSGGLVAEVVACHCSDRVAGLVLVSTRQDWPTSPRPLIDTLVYESLKAPRPGLEGNLRGLIKLDATAIPGRITSPKLLIWGDCDRVVPPIDQNTIVNGVDGARLVVYPDAGHGVHLEQPDRVVSDITDFVRFVGWWELFGAAIRRRHPAQPSCCGNATVVLARVVVLLAGGTTMSTERTGRRCGCDHTSRP